MATLDTGDGSPMELVKGVTNYVSSGGNVANLLIGGVFGTVLSVFTGTTNVIQSTFGLVAGVIDDMGEAAGQIVSGFVTDPIAIVSKGSEVTQTALQDYGIAAFLVGVAVVLGGFWMITQFLQEEETPDVLAPPGFPDIPPLPFTGIDVGVQEEGEEQEDT